MVPTPTAVTSPAALTVATPGEDETKVDPAVRLAVRPEAAAVMVAEPSASPVTTPELLTAATAEASEEEDAPGNGVTGVWMR